MRGSVSCHMLGCMGVLSLHGVYQGDDEICLLTKSLSLVAVWLDKARHQLQSYMQYCQAMSMHCGWPSSVQLTF